MDEDRDQRGSARYDVKAAAGWSRTRADGSDYSRQTDSVAMAAERWAAIQYGTGVDERAMLKGDEGYDFIVWRRGVPVRVDVIHAGTLASGLPRRGRDAHLIVNIDNNKLIRSDVLLFVEGPPFGWVGAIYTVTFLAVARLTDFGFGPKLSLKTSNLLQVDAILPASSEGGACGSCGASGPLGATCEDCGCGIYLGAR